MTATSNSTADARQIVQRTAFSILFTISLAHLLNDMLQAVVPSVYPLIKNRFNLTFSQIGLITLTYQLTASLLQPFVGFYTDRRPRPYSLVVGMGFTLLGLFAVSLAGSFLTVLFSVSLLGIGSSIFHPDSSKVAHLASGGKKGLEPPIC